MEDFIWNEGDIMNDFIACLQLIVSTLSHHKLDHISYEISVDDHDYEVTISYKKI